jgi:hypothetical protein
MQIRPILRRSKTMTSDTGWSTKDLPPKHSLIFTRTRPIRAGWRWRSARGKCEAGNEYVLLAQCNPGKANWQAVLILRGGNTVGAFVIARFEYHGSHPGVHAHANCDKGILIPGAKGLNNLSRLPAIGALHRRKFAWTDVTFWEAAKDFFKFETASGQGELSFSDW